MLLKPARVLVVDDESSIRSLLNRVLAREGYEVLLAATGREGLSMAADEKPDLIILDLNLPDVYGEEVCSKIRQDPAIENTAVLILTAKSDEGLSARCLNGGADDYLPKPFNIDDILAHVRALLRRPRGQSKAGETITKGSLSIRTSERLVFWKERRLSALAPKEFEILCHLVFHAPRVIDKKSLALQVWGVPLDQLHARSIDVHVLRIRKKLGPAASACLKTVTAVGFQWLDDSAFSGLRPSRTRSE